jgi:hypothetical protein
MIAPPITCAARCDEATFGEEVRSHSKLSAVSQPT